MSQLEETQVENAKPERKRDKFGAFLKSSYDKAEEGTVQGFLKGKLALEKGLGLGQTPNAVPPMEAVAHGPHRKVEIGWHPVAGLAGKWFAEQTGLGKMITEKIRAYPDPTQHWAVLVGDYAHQLWMDEHLDVIYTNERIDPAHRADGTWHTFEVGETRFNDEALRQAAEMVIHNMRERKPAYNLISNNCQNFAVNLLDVIHVGAHREFGTTFAIYQRATGKGKIMDLFAPEDADDVQAGAQGQPPGEAHAQAVNNAQKVMDDNTQQLNTQPGPDRGLSPSPSPGHARKRSWWRPKSRGGD
ncbi:hypothetical protein PG985_002391 [Apiospora marii]|uniref:PPPDE domain-containing protein n=1 Tax=Apiospora marii TaxID=335849 RepID=A0ABR1RTY9_9PEZI